MDACMNMNIVAIIITLRYTNYNFIMGVVAVPDLCAMLRVVKCPLREAFSIEVCRRDVSQCPLFGAERRSLLGG